MRKLLFLFTFAFTAFLAQAQVSENFEGGSLCSGFLKCWKHGYTSYIIAEQSGSTANSLCNDPGDFSVNTTSPINGSGSLRLSRSIALDYGNLLNNDTLYNCAYAGDGDVVNLKIKLSDFNLGSDLNLYLFTVNIECGSFQYSQALTLADVNTTFNVNTTISGSGGGGVIKIIIQSGFGNFGGGDPANGVGNYIIDIDDFSTTAGLDMTNSCVTTVLPVSFNDVKATLKKGSLFVTWATATEINNKYFSVELSKDGKEYFELGRVNSMAKEGSSSAPLLYTFSHQLYSATNSYASLTLIGFLLLSSLLMFTFKSKVTRLVLVVLIGSSIGATIACNKNEAVDNGSKAEKFFVRIAQVNKDGTKSYSKVFQVIEEGK